MHDITRKRICALLEKKKKKKSITLVQFRNLTTRQELSSRKSKLESTGNKNKVHRLCHLSLQYIYHPRRERWL